MSRRSSFLMSALLALLSGAPARADFIYEYTTTSPAPSGGGSVSVTFAVPDSVVATGFFVETDINSFLLNLTLTSPPYYDLTATSLSHPTGFMVDPLTGAIIISGEIDVPSSVPVLEEILIHQFVGPTGVRNARFTRNRPGRPAATHPVPEPYLTHSMKATGWRPRNSAQYPRPN